MKFIHVNSDNKKQLKQQFDFVRIYGRSSIFAIPKRNPETGYVYKGLAENMLHANEADAKGKMMCIRIEKTFCNVSNGMYAVIS